MFEVGDVVVRIDTNEVYTLEHNYIDSRYSLRCGSITVSYEGKVLEGFKTAYIRKLTKLEKALL